ncbi:hypothetical protein OAA06_01370 [bacterium]|nr:hypothetical protein [bacterium]
MNTYLILQHPGHNRVYYNLSEKLALAELKIACQHLNTTCTDIKLEYLQGIRYLSISTNSTLTKEDVEILSRLSFVFALFKTEEINNQISLIPLLKSEYEKVDSKISSLLKYPGKTNELFTKMMINVGLLSSNFNYNNKIKLLDPIAGKGTTLYEGLVYGFEVSGIEIEQKSTHEINVFFKKYLENERYKHTSKKRQISGKAKGEAVYINEFDFSKSKDDFKSEDLRERLSIVTGASQEAANYYKKENFHIIVGDLPYGIAHGNQSQQKSANITRNPSELLGQCLPQWHQVLKKGGVVVMAWNSFVIAKTKLEEVFNTNGFKVFTQSPYNDFEHLVDKSIKRDIIVAEKI